ncbi:protein of unknown function [Taphrina deformans PYCC 5710]|uniref:TUG ubiquitin-like domain-containing protein n=1 Tax=Taphrina deformans (strain PYCC 5710 / ATCC 11124 / CBS 356.35 / IMI 108563 / JCM 9778 / NBRC 8474) TaxID=1097556 RepID=R4XKU1_TAPDE|nr:protein of unknown function [Taphrina deformans PYCC 5710]|eukprot:CCG83934.1 protein of unknown function [Taphrina deformans PYCC 5710]
MSSFVTVIHGSRQYRIQCTPAKIMHDVLVEACDRIGLDHNVHALRHGKSNLDPSLSIRLAHLPGGARLDLVSVALNLPGTPRKVVSIAPESSLWMCLEAFEQEYHLGILEASQLRNGQVYRQEPVVQIMNREYFGHERLKSVTLASLGIKSGSAVVRVTYKPTDEALSDAQNTSPQLAISEATNTVSAVPPITNLPVTTEPSLQTKKINLDVVEPVSAAKQRPIEVLIPSKSGTPVFSTRSDEYDDIKMSVEQARVYQAALSSKSQSSGPLLTQKYRDQQAMDKRLKSRPDSCSVKFKFPDNTQVISSFSPSEVSSELHALALTLIEEVSPTFELEVSGDRRRIPKDSQELWRDLHFGKAVAVQVIGKVRVKEGFRQQGKDVGEVLAALDDGESAGRSLAKVDEERPTESTASRANDDGSGAKKVPKWLQKTLGKK